MSQFEMNSEGANEGDQVDRVEDVQAAKDVLAGDVRGLGISDQLRSSDLVADLSLAAGVRYTPEGLSVLRTSYIVFADRVEEDWWLRQVLQIHGDGDVVADASGRVLVESREGLPVAQAAPTYEPLRYVRTVARSVEPMEGPPDEALVRLPAPPEACAGATPESLHLGTDAQHGG